MAAEVTFPIKGHVRWPDGTSLEIVPWPASARGSAWDLFPVLSVGVTEVRHRVAFLQRCPHEDPSGTEDSQLDVSTATKVEVTGRRIPICA